MGRAVTLHGRLLGLCAAGAWQLDPGRWRYTLVGALDLGSGALETSAGRGARPKVGLAATGTGGASGDGR